MRGMIHKVDGAFGAVHQFVARRGQGVREAVVPWGRCGCGRHRRRGSPDAIILEGVIGYLRGLGRAAERRRAEMPPWAMDYQQGMTQQQYGGG